MEVAWAPWRMSYIERGRPERCIFCIDENTPQKDFVLAYDETRLVMLNLFPYNSGHLLVAPRQHVSRLGDLSRSAYADLMDALLASVGIIERVLTPHGMNVGINIGEAAGAGITDHVHWHVVPRWSGDTNYMPVIAEVKVLPEHLQNSYQRLRPHFAAWVAECRR